MDRQLLAKLSGMVRRGEGGRLFGRNKQKRLLEQLGESEDEAKVKYLTQLKTNSFDPVNPIWEEVEPPLMIFQVRLRSEP